MRMEDFYMSELINNVSKERQEKLKAYIQRLHRGEDKDVVEGEFKKDFAYVTGAEIAQMEYNLVQEGVSIEEIQNLCDVHASLFQGSIQQMHDDVLTINPLTEFEDENRDISGQLDRIQSFMDQGIDKLEVVKMAMGSMLTDLRVIEDHYAKKENILFPYLEKGGDFVISKVMWGVDNKIRKALKKALESTQTATNLKALMKEVNAALTMIRDMVTKENNVLYPMLKDKLGEQQFKEIAASLRDESLTEYTAPAQTGSDDDATLMMSMGSLNPTEINAIFNTVPFDMTFVDADNKVKFVSQGKDRIFDRPFSVIGRSVELCHPPQSVDIVLKIVEDLRAGKKDHEDFWINFKNRFVFIRYYAVRDAQGTFLGTLEVTQDAGEIKALEGEKRLMSM